MLGRLVRSTLYPQSVTEATVGWVSALTSLSRPRLILIYMLSSDTAWTAFLNEEPFYEMRELGYTAPFTQTYKQQHVSVQPVSSTGSLRPDVILLIQTVSLAWMYRQHYR